MLPNACPKPRPVVKPPKALRKVNRARKAEDDKRVYGSIARRKWVSLQPCAACGAWEASQGAHVLGVDGMGRKKDYRTIAPLCTVRENLIPGAPMWPGCHHIFDERQDEFRILFPKFNAKQAARATERAWQKFQRGDAGGER